MTTLHAPVGRQKAVVVDDSESSLAMMIKLLQTIEGCDAIGFTDSTHALKWCLNNDIDLLVVDYEMPQLNGLTFVQSFRDSARNESVPVVMVTSSADQALRYRALEQGATDFLRKPIDFTEFLARSRNLLSSRRAHKTLAGISEWLSDEVHKTSMVLQQSPLSVVITNQAGEIEYANPKYLETTGSSSAEVIGGLFPLLTPSTSHPGLLEEIWDSLLKGNIWRGACSSRHKNGAQIWESVILSPIRDKQGAISHLVAIIEDVSRHREYEARLVWMGTHDEVTGLPNRSLLLSSLDDAIESSVNGAPIALLTINVLRHREIVGFLGHKVKDEMMRLVARRLGALCGEGDLLARLGSADFAIVTRGSRAAITVLAKEVAACFQDPMTIGAAEVMTHVRVGIALHPQDGASGEALLRCAGAATASIRETNRGSWRFYHTEIDIGARSRHSIEIKLRSALRNNEFELEFQPLFDLRSGRIAAAECLLRWRNGELGRVAPEQFVPIAEETGMMGAIGDWVVVEACRNLAGWRAAGHDLDFVTVNLSSGQLADPALTDRIEGILQDYRLAPQDLELDLCGDSALEAARPRLAELRELGVKVALDRFGSHATAISCLAHLCFDRLKIDRSLIQGLPRDEALVASVVAMARTLGLSVDAVGLESALQLDVVGRLGCDLAQGHFLARPMLNADFTRLLSTGPNAAAPAYRFRRAASV